jgi:hypothetical protein
MDDMDDSLLDGLNHLVNMADKPQQATKAAKPSAAAGSAGKSAPAAKPVQNNVDTASAQPVFNDETAKQIIERLDSIKQSIDAIPRADQDGPATNTNPASSPVVAKPEPAKPEKPATPPKPKDPRPEPKPDKAPTESHELSRSLPYVALVTAAFVLVAFALGMGYGAIVASGKFPYWYQPGLPGALADWIAAPAGVLLLPVVAGLLALGGLELRREGQSAAKPVFIAAGGLLALALVLPFMV